MNNVLVLNLTCKETCHKFKIKNILSKKTNPQIGSISLLILPGVIISESWGLAALGLLKIQLTGQFGGKEVKWKLLSRVPTLCDPLDYTLWNSPGQNTGVGSLSLLQGIFPTQESKPGLLHCRQILYQLSYQGSPGGKESLLYFRCWQLGGGGRGQTSVQRQIPHHWPPSGTRVLNGGGGGSMQKQHSQLWQSSWNWLLVVRAVSSCLF